MKSYLDANSTKFLADLDRLDKKQDRVQREISSGYRVSLPSDAPEDMIDIVQLRSDVARADAVRQTLGRVQSEVNTAEAGMQVAAQLLERARTVAAQNATSTASNRKGFATEVRELHQQLVDITRTLSSGRYVFSGDADQTPMYTVDWSQTTTGGIVRNVNPGNTRQVQDINGTSFGVTLTAGQIFDTRDSSDNPDQNNVFNAVYALAVALEADSESGVQDAVGLLNTALDHLGRQLTFYGNAQNRVANAITLANRSSLQRTKELASLQDTDLERAVVDLATVKVHREATLGAQSQKPRTSLFNYLG